MFLKNTTVFLDNKTCLNIKFLGQTFHPSFVVLLTVPWHWVTAKGKSELMTLVIFHDTFFPGPPVFKEVEPLPLMD